jgi:hypothetical protein
MSLLSLRRLSSSLLTTTASLRIPTALFASSASGADKADRLRLLLQAGLKPSVLDVEDISGPNQAGAFNQSLLFPR